MNTYSSSVLLINDSDFKTIVTLCEAEDGKSIDLIAPNDNFLPVYQILHACDNGGGRLVRVYNRGLERLQLKTKEWYKDNIRIVCTNCLYEVNDLSLQIAIKVLFLYTDTRLGDA